MADLEGFQGVPWNPPWLNSDVLIYYVRTMVWNVLMSGPSRTTRTLIAAHILPKQFKLVRISVADQGG